MIEVLRNLPKNVAGFRALGEVTQKDFETVIIPGVEKLITETGKINFLLLLDTQLKDFSVGAWFEDAILGIKNISKWNRAAIVSDAHAIAAFTNALSVIIPGEFKGFSKARLAEAIEWTGHKD